MLIREYQPGDLDALQALHAAQGFAYPFPDLSDPLFVSKLVLEDAEPDAPDSEPKEPPGDASGGTEKSARIAGALLLRLTAEAYLLLDPRSGTPRRRWKRFHALHAAAERDAWRRGLADVHAWLPPAIAQRFGRRLAQLGWVRDDAWTPFCKRVEPQP